MSIGTSRDLAKSDTPNDSFSWVLVTDTAGSIVYGQRGGNTTTITVAPVGVWMPVGNATHVTTGSTAEGIVVA